MYNPYQPYGPDNMPENDTSYTSPAETGGQPEPHPYYSYTPWGGGSAPVPPKKKKEKKGVTRGALAGTAAACLMVSLACGFGGGYLAGRMGSSGSDASNSAGKPVIYQSVADSSGTGELSVADVVARAADSVVEVTTKTNSGYFGEVATGAGSGVILTADGYIVTNHHVVDGGSAFTVRTRSGDTYEACLVGSDSQTDLAVLKIDAEGLTPAVLGDSDKLVVGETAVAIGNPLGELGGTVTSGIISALSREITTSAGATMELLQTNAAINPGNSGGGLFNSSGELIGIVNAKSVGEDIEGLGFAIPINTAKSVIEDLISDGYVRGRIDTGFTVVDLTDQATALQYGVRQTGIYILSVSDRADGFRSGDLILAMDGEEIADMEDYNRVLNAHEIGDTISVTISRSYQQMTLVLHLQEAGAPSSSDSARA